MNNISNKEELLECLSNVFRITQTKEVLVKEKDVELWFMIFFSSRNQLRDAPLVFISLSQLSPVGYRCEAVLFSPLHCLTRRLPEILHFSQNEKFLDN